MMAARSRPRPAPAPLRWCWDPGPCGRCWCGACPPRCQGAHASSRFSRLSPPGNRTIPKSRRSRVAIRRSPCSWATQSSEAPARSSGKSPYCRIQPAINSSADPLSSATLGPASDTAWKRISSRIRGCAVKAAAIRSRGAASRALVRGQQTSFAPVAPVGQLLASVRRLQPGCPYPRGRLC